MAIKVGINGFGRIGRSIFRASSQRCDIEVVAINDLQQVEHIAYLLKYDSTHGKFPGSIDIDQNYLVVNGKRILITSNSNPCEINWSLANVEVVIEATGNFLDAVGAGQHLKAGAQKVVLTAPPKDSTPMFVMGVNHYRYAGQSIISNASCTTNCLAPIAKVLHEKYGIIEGLMTTVHSMTATQRTVDGSSNKNWRAGRGAIQNIIPFSTGAAIAVGKVIPELNGKLTGISFRVPTPNVSVVDLTCRFSTATSYSSICQLIKEATVGSLRGIVEYTDEAVVSSDFIGATATAIFDATAGLALTPHFMKIVVWYDNEVGYSHKILDLISYIMS